MTKRTLCRLSNFENYILLFKKKAQSTRRKLLQPTPLRLTYSTPSTPNRFVEEEAESEVVVLPSSSGDMDEPSDVSYGQRTCHWEECVTVILKQIHLNNLSYHYVNIYL